MEWLQLYADLAFAVVLAFLFPWVAVQIYEGARRHWSIPKKPGGIGLIVSGLLIACTFAALSAILAIVVSSMNSPFEEVVLTEDWGTAPGFTPELRVEQSTGIARLNFKFTGKQQRYMNLDGEWMQFCPDDEAVASRDEIVYVRAQIDAGIEGLYTATFGWMIFVLVPVVLGRLAAQGRLFSKKG